MNKVNFLGITVFISLSLTTCVWNNDGFNSGLIVARSETDLDRNNGRRDTASGKCEEYRDCERGCEEVYDPDNEEENLGKVDACIDLPYNTAIYFEDFLDILEDPHESDLRRIAENYDRAFSDFLDISRQPWVDALDSVSNSEAEYLLIWIAKYPRISQAIYDANENLEKDLPLYEGVAELFKEVDCDHVLIEPNLDFQTILTNNNNTVGTTIYNQVCPEPAS